MCYVSARSQTTDEDWKVQWGEQELEFSFVPGAPQAKRKATTNAEAWNGCEGEGAHCLNICWLSYRGKLLAPGAPWVLTVH